MTHPRSMRGGVAATVILALILMPWAVSGCGGGGSGPGLGLPTSAGFTVTDTSGAVVAGATVFLVPANAVDGGPITGTEVNNGAAADRDEPLEDEIRLHGSTYPSATTDAVGHADFGNVPPGDYFWFVSPGPGDSEHLPGGSGCRTARNTSTFLGTAVAIELSSRPGPAATYKGSSTCLVCHPGFSTQAQHAHHLGFSIPGQPGPMQDHSRYPDFQTSWNAFVPAATFAGGTAIWCSDFDPSRGFDKFKTSLASPSGTVYLKVWLWRDNADGKAKITLQNIINPADPSSPRTLEVPLTYGGALFAQINLVKVPGRNGLYPLMQRQPQGNETRFDRTRKVYRDWHLDNFWNNTTQAITNPPVSSNFEASCTGCHSTGFQRIQDTLTGEYVSRAVHDLGGEYDIDHDGVMDEINVGCETCHGPGSDHVAWAANPQNTGHQARFIVQPAKLSPSREVMICGRCHDRPAGNGPVVTDEPLNPQGLMAPAGISRQDFLAQYVTRNGPAATDFWSDGIHSKNHYQQSADFVKSKMHRNNRILTVCSDCHDNHGQSPYVHQLRDDPANPNSTLCLRCHATDLISHMMAQTNATHGGNSTLCIDCHMTKTAKSGAGRYGILLGFPSGTATDNSITYFENDISSHLFGVPRKTHPDVAGVLPSSAMPIPYTKSCGAACHDAAPLQSSFGFNAIGPQETTTGSKEK